MFAGLATLVMAAGLGWADPGAAVDLLSGRRVIGATAFALVASVCWVAVAVLVAMVTAATARRRAMSAPPLTALMVLGAAVLLALGLAGHSHSYGVCCATPASAAQADEHAR